MTIAPDWGTCVNPSTELIVVTKKQYNELKVANNFALLLKQYDVYFKNETAMIFEHTSEEEKVDKRKGYWKWFSFNVIDNSKLILEY